ncbi:MAG: GGDEF domain-containing protein [Planctomycetes bacterium]|nr:GGDEF domain-containing protein [Planctomycetota bacterium]
MSESELPQILSEFLSLGEECKIAKGNRLWNEGEAGDCVVLLLEGRVEVSHNSPSGNPVPLAVLEVGAVIGEMACIDGSPRSASVQALSACRYLRIPATAFRKLIHARPDLLEELFWLQVERVRRLTDNVVASFDRAYTDPLTHVYTRNFLDERLRMEFRRAAQMRDSLCVLVVAPDDFKGYNERNGDAAGDLALTHVAQYLMRTVRRGDIVARYSGAEFAVMLYGAIEAEGMMMANRLRRRLAAVPIPGSAGQPGGKFTLTVGLTCYPLDGGAGDAPGLLATAVEHLRRAREAGGNCVYPPRARS